MRPEPDACSSLRGICSGVLSPCSLAEPSRCLTAVFSPPFPSVCTGKGGYHLGGPAEVEFWGRWPEVSVAGIRACRNGGSRTRGELAAEPRLLPELPPALDGALRRLQSWWSTGRQACHYPLRAGVRSSPSKSCRISFFIIRQFLCH